MHIIAGQPGTGKTTLAMKMAGTVSAGRRWPDGTEATKGKVIIWSGEDDPADTLVPRLEASGADLSRIFFAGEMSCGKERRDFDPAKDITALQAAIETAGGASLIIVDPIVSATAADSHKNSETRRGLQPLVDMTAPLDPIGMDEGRMGDPVPLPHEPRAGPQGDRRRGFGRAAARRTGGGLRQLPDGGLREAAIRPLLKLINDPSDQEVAGEPHRRRHPVKPPPLAAQLEDGHLREPHERLCDIDRRLVHVSERAAFRCDSDERRRWLQG